MDKEKEIEEMAEVICQKNERMFTYHGGHICTPREQAVALSKAGYGNVKQVAREILKDLKDRSVWFIIGTAQFVQDHFWEQFEEMCATYGVDVDE